MSEGRTRDPYIFVVDTHTLVWYVEQSPKLGKNAEHVLTDPDSTLLIPSIVLAEARYLSAKRPLAASWSEVSKFVLSDHRVWVFPLDEDIVADMPLELEMHDAIICAVCIFYDEYLLEDAAVLTKDRKIIESGLVQTIW